jgi:hypothetical protein
VFESFTTVFFFCALTGKAISNEAMAMITNIHILFFSILHPLNRVPCKSGPSRIPVVSAVVGYVLGSDTDAINRILQKGVEAVISGNGRGHKAASGIIGCAQQYFFPPVAYNIPLQQGVAFVSVVGKSSFENGYTLTDSFLPIIFADYISIQ